MGQKGSMLISKSVAYKADIIKVKAVNTVGAGDSMLAGFLYGLCIIKSFNTEEKIRKALTYGVASSSIAISTLDHKPFPKSKLEELSQKVRIYEL